MTRMIQTPGLYAPLIGRPLTKVTCNECFGEAAKPWMPPCEKCRGAGFYFVKTRSRSEVR